MDKIANIKKAAGVFTASIIITGCASTSEPTRSAWDTKRVLCVAASGLAGAALDAASNNSSDGASKGAGVIVGAGLGAIFCAPGAVLDGDKDGVVDQDDQCPLTPHGVEVDAKGCALDDDNDGVANIIDQCPNTLAGVEVDSVGCEVFKDSDGDGVEDAADQCPNTPFGTAVNAVGCEENAAIILDGVFFEYKSSDLTANSKIILDKVASKLVAADARILVAGYTDSIGSDKYNLKLSEQRAASVKDYLVAQGVPSANISSQGLGEDNPIASNDTDEGRAQNRRVEMEVAN